MAPMLSDWDFFGGRLTKPDSRIFIIVTITDFAPGAAPNNFPDWFRGESAAQPVWWNENKKVVDCTADCPPEYCLTAQIVFRQKKKAIEHPYLPPVLLDSRLLS
jgi:hypothetical protein